jgi:hypothetical protein
MSARAAAQPLDAHSDDYLSELRNAPELRGISCARMRVMKVLVLYRPGSEFARNVEEFLRDLREIHNLDERDLRVLDYDSREGSATASMYDIMSQPAILVTANDGGYVKHWEGSSLPLMDEVASYIYSYN